MDNAEYGKLFARNLNYFMDLNGKTQSDLSRDLSISKATISSWCNGTRVPRMDKVELLCRYFGIKRSDLMEDKKEKQEKGYYLNEDAKKLLQAYNDRSDLKILFDASKNLTKEDVDFIIKLIEKMKKE